MKNMFVFIICITLTHTMAVNRMIEDSLSIIKNRKNYNYYFSISSDHQEPSCGPLEPSLKIPKLAWGNKL